MVEMPVYDPTDTDVERRLHRLEESVAALQDTKLVEDRIVDRVTQRLKRAQQKQLRDSTAVEETPSTPQGDESAVPEVESPPPVEAPTPRRGWLLLELWSDIRTYLKLLFDHRYRVSLLGRLGPLAIGLAYAFTMFFIGGWVIVGSTLERVIDIVLAILLYKICVREVNRYRAHHG